MLPVLKLCGNPIRALSATTNHWQFSLTGCLTSPLRQGQTLCTKEQPCVHILPCSLKGVGDALGDKQGRLCDLQMPGNVLQGSKAVIRSECWPSSPLCILTANPAWGRPSNLRAELAACFLWVPRNNKSQVKSERLTCRRECRPTACCCFSLWSMK